MKRLFALCMISLLLSGCAAGISGKARYPNQATAEAKARFASADTLYKQKRLAEADSAFASLIADFPYTQLTDEARFLRGEIAFLKKDYDAAIAFYREAFSQIASPSVAPKAIFKSSLALVRSGKSQEALMELEKMNRAESSAVLKLRADSLGIKLTQALNLSPNIAIAWHLFLLDDYAESQGVRPTGIPENELVAEGVARAEVKRWMEDQSVTAQDVKALPLKAMKGKRSGGFAEYKLALALHSEGKTGEAIHVLKSYITTYPKHENYGAARILMGEMGGVIGPGAGVAVGVLLPLSGKYAVYGESVLHGIECAVGLRQPCVGPTGIQLVVKDSGSTPAEAIQAVEEMAQANVIGIVGPLLSTNASEAAQKAQELGIPIISLSQRSGVAEIGEFVFRNSVSDSLEMSTLADYAVKRAGLKRFLILYPSGSRKASEYRELFTNAVQGLGATAVEAKSYGERTHVTGPSNELRGRGQVEFGAKQVEQKHQTQTNGDDEEEMKEAEPKFKATGYDAVFIPDSLGLAAAMVKRIDFSGPGSLTILGISRWDEKKRSGRSDASMNGAVFVDSFYRDAPEEHISSFVSRFRSAYGNDPTLLEALGFDSMQMITQVAQQKRGSNRQGLRDALAKISNFPGVSGKTTMNSDGDAQRELRILMFKEGSLVPVE